MAKLSAFKRNPVAMREGEWINPGPEYDGLEIKAKAMGADYADMKAGLIRAAARRAGGEDKIGQEERNEIEIQCLIKKSLLDVRGVTNDDGTPVSFKDFCEVIQLPEAGELAVACFIAAGMVGRKNAELIEQAEGNLSKGLRTTSNGQTTPIS